jgi:hypothetical protein
LVSFSSSASVTFSDRVFVSSTTVPYDSIPYRRASAGSRSGSTTFHVSFGPA